MESSNKKSYKQISFDLDTKLLEVYYPKENWRNAYNDIKNFMRALDFSWQQGSVYISNNAITSRAITIILSSLIEKHPWINLCMRDCRETNIVSKNNRNYMFNKSINLPTRYEAQNQKQSFKNLLSEAKNKSDFYNQSQILKQNLDKIHSR